MLCGYFYSDVEETRLSETSQNPDPVFGRRRCFISQEKTLTNFDVITEDGDKVGKVGMTNRFPWCGYLFDMVSLEVRCDLSQITGLALRDTLSVTLNAHRGQALCRNLPFSVRLKCHRLLLNHYRNLRETVLLNVYKLFLTAHNFRTYAKDLPGGHQPKHNRSFFCGLLVLVPKHFHSTSTQRSQQLSPYKDILNVF